MDDERLLGMRQIMQMTSLSRPTIRKYIRNGDFPDGYRVGKVKRWKRSDIQEWIKHLELYEGKDDGTDDYAGGGTTST